MRIKHQESDGIEYYKSRWFYEQCCQCKDRVKNEPMWALHHAGFYNDSLYSYWCHDCFPTRESLKEFINRKPEPPKER